MFDLLHRMRAELAELHPLLPYIAIAAIVGGLVWLWRRYAPKSFEKLPQSLQALPALLISAVLAGASSGGDIGRMMVDAVVGAFAGLLSVGGHEALKRLPGPYAGGKWPAAGTDTQGMADVLSSKKAAPKPPPMPIILILLGWLGVFTPSCAASQDPPGCSLADQKAISAQESAEALYACQGKGEDCSAAKDIHTKYRQAREDWFFRCQP